MYRILAERIVLSQFPLKYFYFSAHECIVKGGHLAVNSNIHCLKPLLWKIKFTPFLQYVVPIYIFWGKCVRYMHIYYFFYRVVVSVTLASVHISLTRLSSFPPVFVLRNRSGTAIIITQNGIFNGSCPSSFF